MKAKVKWVDGQQFVGMNERNMPVVMDSLPEGGGEGAGLKPTELFLIALAGCTGIDVISIMKKKRQKVTSFSVEIEGIQEEEFPKPFNDIKLIYRVRGENIDVKALESAIKLSEEKYCSIRATLAGQPNITHEYVIEP
ncbi:MAG: OsmC family protein [Candidatus Aquicultor sp.]